MISKQTGLEKKKGNYNLESGRYTEGGVGLTERQQPTKTVRQAVTMTFTFGSTFTTSGARLKPESTKKARVSR